MPVEEDERVEGLGETVLLDAYKVMIQKFIDDKKYSQAEKAVRNGLAVADVPDGQFGSYLSALGFDPVALSEDPDAFPEGSISDVFSKFASEKTATS